MSKKITELLESNNSIVDLLNCIIDYKNDDPAVYYQKKSQSYTFRQLSEKIDNYTLALQSYDIKENDKVLILFEPSPKFIFISFALFKLKAIPVFIDSGMELSSMVNTFKELAPSFIIGNKKAAVFFKLFKNKISQHKIFIPIKDITIKSKHQAHDVIIDLNIDKNDIACIVFTSGSTGKSKGVIYTHNMFLSQMRIIYKKYKINKYDIDMSIFPLFALLSVTMGMPSVIPNINFSSLLKNKAKVIVSCIEKYQVSFSFASPTLWGKVANYLIKNKKTLPTMKKILMAGCSVDHDIIKKMKLSIPQNCHIYIPYGATESLPIANITGKKLISYANSKMRKGHGTCLGTVIDDSVKIKIIKNHVESTNKFKECKVGEVGELIVQSDATSPSYLNSDSSKIYSSDNTFWHQMGDMVYIDEKGFLWLCGRKADVVTINKKTYYSDQCENIFNQHEDIARSALIQHQNQAIIVVELKKKYFFMKKNVLKRIKQDLLLLAEVFDITKGIQEFIFMDNFFVDVRHNAKIKRQKIYKLLIKKNIL